MGDLGAVRARFLDRVRRLARRARRDCVIRRGSAGLFYGLLPGCVAVLLAGSLTFPIPALAISCCGAAAGLLAGVLAALLRPIDRRRLLIHADQTLGSRELASTAYELARAGENGHFASAITEDAADLLTRSPPRRILGRVRPRLAVFLPAPVALIVLGLLLPVDFRALFPPRDRRSAELALIGEDLRSHGERLREAARAGDVGRSLALSQELAQLGQDLAERGMGEEEAQERIADLEARVGAEYQLRLEEVLRKAGAGGKGDGVSEGNGGTPRAGSSGEGDSGAGSEESEAAEKDQELKDLRGMRDRLNNARRRLSEGGEGDSGPGGSSTARKPKEGGGGGKGSGGQSPGTGNPQQQPDMAPDSGPGKEGEQGMSGQEGDMEGSAPGLTPAPDKTGAPTEIPRGDANPPLQAQGLVGEGESTRLLARALPEWTGSALPEARVLGSYARQAESALARDEVPLELKEYVKEYFTIIGISKGGAGE